MNNKLPFGDEPVLVTGSAGFIGFHVSRALLSSGFRVVGMDNLNDYYDPALKLARLELLHSFPNFTFNKISLENREEMRLIFEKNSFQWVIHLAAQAGVRYSLVNPHAYTESNLTGFLNILEGCRQAKTKHLVFASSSSVYGGNTKMPFSVRDGVDHPLSLYGATKRANELMAHSYSYLFQIPSTGLRFFTVYGPWGRPDMALFLFTRSILQGKAIQIFNHGNMQRDFTYIDDIVEGILRIAANIPSGDDSWSSEQPSPESSSAPYRIYNIGNHQPVALTTLISLLEQELGKKSEREFLPMQAGDVPATFADVESLIPS